MALAHHEAVASGSFGRVRIVAHDAEIERRQDVGRAEVAAGMAQLRLIDHLEAAAADPQRLVADERDQIIAGSVV